MKKSVIKDIFHGVRGHMETMGVPKDYFERGDDICVIYEQLKEKLSPEMLALHQKFVDAFESDHSLRAKSGVKKSFSLQPAKQAR